jgi:hypothetical protein
MEQINRGVFEVVNPFNRQVKQVPATPTDVHTIVFWSKNFDVFLKKGFGQNLQKTGYNLFFNFTINSYVPRLEPHVPQLADRLEQLKKLSDRFGSEAINWRFDPICFFRIRGGVIEDNLDDLDRIAAKAAECGIRRCITSFMDSYPKIKKRLTNMPDFSFWDPPLEVKKEIILKMERTLNASNINLQLCCEKETLGVLPADTTITESACIPNDLLKELFGGNLSLKKDTGQRVKKGCGCKVSVDIGSYQDHPCFHNCLFCYANPASK